MTVREFIGEQRASDGKRIGKRAVHTGWKRTPENRAMFYGVPSDTVYNRTYMDPIEHETQPPGRCITLMRAGQRVTERLV